MTQAPTPGPLSGDDWDAIRAHPCFGEHQPGCDCVIPDQRLAPTAPVEDVSTKSSETNTSAERVKETAENEHVAAPVEESGSEREIMDMIVAHLGLNVSGMSSSAGTLAKKIVQHLRPQPSGETLEAVARLTEWRDRMKADEGRGAHFGSPYADKPMANGRTYWNRDLAADLTTILALIRPAPVASGGQHSSGEGER